MKRFVGNKWFKRGVAIVLAIAVVACAITGFKNMGKSKEVDADVSTAIVSRRNVTNTVTGSGTVEAYESYNIVPTVMGDIVFCDVEEGDWVELDQVLYRFDTDTSDNAISKAENSVENAALSLEQAQENVDNLTIKAPIQGVISNLGLIIGDRASGTVCTITDNTYMIAEIPVSAAAVKKINVGDSVTVGIEKYMATMSGIVDRKSSGAVAGENGTMVTMVDVVIENPGAIANGTYCSATFHTSLGDVEGAQAAELKYPDSAKATAEQSGTVETLNVKNGDWVNKGDVIAVLENSQVKNQLRTAQMNYSDAISNLADRRKAAEDYILTAPIAGKVMAKNYKKGDTVAGNNSTTLMVVADTTKMKFTINVDELDVAKITIGQEVSITADAIENVEFKGAIETISLLGTSSSGVTYYPVQVVIEEPGNLIPGMNVSAEIIVEKAENVLAVPASAVTYYAGKNYVNIVGEIEADFNVGKEQKPLGVPEEMPTGNMSGGKPMGNMNGSKPMGNMSGKPMEGMPEMKQNMYDEPLRVEVTTGVSDDDYIEITSGLKEGQIVEVTESSGGGNGWGQMFGGGMPGGRMPGGMR